MNAAAPAEQLILFIQDQRFKVVCLQPELLPAESNFLTCLYTVGFIPLSHSSCWATALLIRSLAPCSYCWSILYHFEETIFATRTIVPSSSYNMASLSQSIRALNLTVFIVVY